MKKFRQFKESLDHDVSSFSHRRLSTILRNPSHPMHSAAKAERDRRMQTQEGAMKRIATTQSNKADRMASTDKKGLETYKKKVDEISLDMLTKKISNSGMKSTKKAMGADKTKKDLEAMKARLATEASSNKLSNYMRASAADVAKSRGDAKRQDKRIAGQKMADEKIRKKQGYSSTAKVPAGTNEEKDTHVTKDGRTVKKGLWYYMNKRKKAGTSRPKSAGTVDPKAMKKSQK